MRDTECFALQSTREHNIEQGPLFGLGGFDFHSVPPVAGYRGYVVARRMPQQLQSYLSQIVRQFMGGPADGPVPVHFPAADDIGQLVARQA
jgi:hypothetical protein